MIPRNSVRLLGFAALAAMLTACALVSTDPSPSPSPQNPRPTPGRIPAPSTLIHPGTITFLSDTTYPPQESIDPSTNKAVGFDVDIANALASRMGLTATITTANFDDSINALLAGQGDAIISAMTVTPERQKSVAFVGYFTAGQSILVRKGNPLQIHGLSDLCGHTVAVELSTTEQATLAATNSATCNGRPITIQAFKTDAEAVQKLKDGSASAAMDDSPVAAYYVQQAPADFELAGQPVQSQVEGMAVNPKNRELLGALQQAMIAIMADGSYHKLLAKWNLLIGEIPPSQVVITGTAG
jgi:polar amino acid transport system substrate-binding protein